MFRFGARDGDGFDGLVGKEKLGFVFEREGAVAFVNGGVSQCGGDEAASVARRGPESAGGLVAVVDGEDAEGGVP